MLSWLLTISSPVLSVVVSFADAYGRLRRQYGIPLRYPHKKLLLKNCHSSWIFKDERGYSTRLSYGNDIRYHIDGEELFRAIAESIQNARFTVFLQQSWFRPGFTATFSEEKFHSYHPEQMMTQLLLDASRRGVEVKILLNKNLLLPDTFKAIRDFFQEAGDNAVNVRQFSLNIQFMHGKSLIVDSSTAFVIGSAFEQGYWDTTEHLQMGKEPRRGVGATGIRKPMHDVSLQIAGPAVTDLENNFIQMWNFVSDEKFGGKDKIPKRSVQPFAGTQSLQILRSVSQNTLGLEDGEKHILYAYIQAIKMAEDFIYLENQYFSNLDIINALVEALQSKPNLQLIILLNENPDIPLYKQWQNKRLKQLGVPHPRVGVFSLWTYSSKHFGRKRLGHCYVHSKLAVIDDKWATVGTANLDGISMHGADEFCFSNRRSMEINAVIFDGIEGLPATGNARRLRMALWKEHLNMEMEQLDRTPGGGWLRLWNEIAEANVASLNSLCPRMKGRVLPYRPEVSEKRQLRGLGINTLKIHTRD